MRVRHGGDDAFARQIDGVVETREDGAQDAADDAERHRRRKDGDVVRDRLDDLRAEGGKSDASQTHGNCTRIRQMGEL